MPCKEKEIPFMEVPDPRRRNPRALASVVSGASEAYCSICNSNPCYLLSTAAIAVMQEQLNVENNLIGAIRYRQALMHLEECVKRHIDTLTDEYSLDEHFRVSPEVLEALKADGIDIKRLEKDLATEAELEDLHN